ncbi:transcriptional regulator GcvA [Inquilinus sp. NPDC058860]|uniref:transcriptional regulator GcvA n=1 Tax=Inquilinus sp. NPDC058860 TaxID=3346652 RepID=UPI0036787CE6
MRRRLPPLNGVRAFEAAARHESFTRAAEELAVTQAAVSQQVRRLEDWLGAKLFDRTEGGLELTDTGRSYLPVLRDAFDAIAEATARIRPPPHSGILTVSAIPSFIRKWLVSRMPSFNEQQPEIDVNLDAESRLVDFSRDRVDCAIRFGSGAWEGVVAEKLFSEDTFPVCSPALVEAGLCQLEDLRRFRLLHDETLVQWKHWLRAAGMEDLGWVRGPRTQDSALLIQMAIEGQGVALAQRVLVMDDLRAGRLVRPFWLSLPIDHLKSDYAYYFVAPPNALNRPLVRAFRDWLFAVAAEAEASPEEPMALPAA